MPKPKTQVQEIEETDEETVEETPAKAITPKMLAEELEVDAKRIRAYLRREFSRDSEAFRTSWNLTEAQANAVRGRFTPSEDEDADDSDEA